MANPWKEAAKGMLQAGISGVGSTNPSFYPSKEQVDQYNYGQASWDAQTWNRPSFQKPPDADENWHQNRGPWLSSEVSEMINPSVAERQYGLNAYPGAASNWANIYNQGFDNYRFDSPKDMRDTMNWARAKDLLYSTKPSWEEYGMYDTLDSPSIMDELYAASETSEDFIDQTFRSKYEDINDWLQDETTTLDESLQTIRDAADMMKYGRENPFLIEDDGGWTARDPMEIAYRYGLNVDPELALPPENIGVDRAGYTPALPPENIGMDRSGETSLYIEPALPPENIGMDRAPEEILAAPEVEVEDDRSILEKILPFIPPIITQPWLSPGMAGKALGLFSPDDIYQDPIMNMAAGDIPAQPMSEFDMSEADSYSPQNLIQLYQDALDAGNEDEAEMYLNDLQLRYPTLV